MTVTAHIGLPGLIDDLEALAADRDTVTLGELLDALGARGHGPIILTLAALMMLPTGMIPFMPSIIGVLLALTAAEMIAGGRGVSVPARIARINIRGDLLKAALQRARKVCASIGRWLHPRARILVHGHLSLLLIAMILLAAAAVMIVIGAIPGLPFILCVPALLFGLGLTAGDGLVVGVGFAATLAAAAAVFSML